MTFAPLNAIRAAIGEDKARWLEQNGSILPPHPGMLHAYMWQASVGHPFTEKVLSEAEKTFRKKEVAISHAPSTKELQTFHNAFSFPTLISREYYEKEPEISLYPCLFCAYPNVKPYHLSSYFSLNFGKDQYHVQIFAIFETSDYFQTKDCSFAVDIFADILKRSVKKHNPKALSNEGIRQALQFTFRAFRDQLEAVGYNLQKTTAVAAIIICNQLWTIKVGPAGAFVSSTSAMNSSFFFKENLESSVEKGKLAELWAQVEISMTPFGKIPEGSLGVVGSRGLISKIPPKKLCRGMEVYQATHQGTRLSPSDIATNLIFSARRYPRSPVEEASVIVFELQEGETSVIVPKEDDPYVFIDKEEIPTCTISGSYRKKTNRTFVAKVHSKISSLASSILGDETKYAQKVPYGLKEPYLVDSDHR